MSNIRAKFIQDDRGRDMVELSIIGDPNTFIRKVRPEDAKDYPAEWDAFIKGRKEVEYGGSPLTDVPGIDANLSAALKFRGVHNVEQLAKLDDAAAKGLGMGGITMRDTARLVLTSRGQDTGVKPFVSQREAEVTAALAEMPKRRGRPPKAVAPVEVEDHELAPVED